MTIKYQIRNSKNLSTHTTHTDIAMTIYFVNACRRHATILFDNNIYCITSLKTLKNNENKVKK